MYKKVSLNTFTSKDTIGSHQYLHICDSLEQRDQMFTRHNINDDTDHSFIYCDEATLNIRWKNRVGEIQVCGSGAYASAYYFINTHNLNKLTLKAPSIVLDAELTSQQVILNIPIKPTEHVIHYTEHNIFENNESGIYFIELKSEVMLKTAEFKKYHAYLKDVDDIHGLCLFSWDIKNKIGYVRYFTPWHGRDEDSVTGSIHQYLTPLINKKYQVIKQKWIQTSKRGGVINTSLSGNVVSLHGECS